MSLILKDLYRFSSYVPPIDLTFNQYLLLTDEPVLVHTGTISQAAALLPDLKAILGKKNFPIFLPPILNRTNAEVSR